MSSPCRLVLNGRRFLILAVVLAASGAAAEANEIGLVGGSAGSPANWTDSSAWRIQGTSTAGVPGSADDVWIGAAWNNGSNPAWVTPAYVTLSSGTQAVSNLNLGRTVNYIGGVRGQGTLNVTGVATRLTVGNQLLLGSYGENNGNSAGTLNIDAATVTVAADSTAATGGPQSNAAISIANGGNLSFAGNFTVGGNNTAQSLATIGLGGASKLNVGNSLNLNGMLSGFAGQSWQINVANDLSLTGSGTYSLPLASTPTNGTVSFGRSLTVAGGNSQNVNLTVGYGSASTMYFTGGLYVASIAGNQGSRGSLTVDGNQTMSFAGDGNFATGYGTNPSASNTQAAVNVINGARLNLGNNLLVGNGNNNNGQQVSSATIGVDGASQLNVAGSLYLRGSGTYSLPLASTPANGKLSFSGNLFLADTNYNNVNLAVSSSSAASMSYGALNMATATSSSAALAMDGSRSMTFAADSNVATAGSSQAAISLTNGAQLNFAGNLTVGQGNAAANPATLTLSGASQLNVVNSLGLNGTLSLGSGAQLNVFNSLSVNGTLGLDSASQLNVTNDLSFTGSGTYNLPLAPTPTNGAASFGRSLILAGGNFQNVNLTVGNGSAAAMTFTGGLYIASNSSQGSRGTLTVDGNRTVSFAGDGNVATGYGTNPATSNNQAAVNATNGARLNLGGNLLVGNGNGTNGQQVSSGTLNVDAASQLNAAGSLYLRGSGAYSLPLASTPANGMVSFASGLYLADTAYNNVNLTVSNSSAASMNFGGALNMATATASSAALAMDGNRTMGFFGDSFLATGGSSQAAISLTNGANLNFGGNLTVGQTGSLASLASLTLSGASQIFVGNSLGLNGALTLGSSSQLNATTDLSFTGSGTYNLLLASTPANGMLSFSRNLTIAGGASQNVSLTVSNSSATAMSYSGALNAATGLSSTASFSIDGSRTMRFAGDSYIATGGSSQAAIGLTNGANLNFGGSLTFGQAGTPVSLLPLTLGGTSQLNVGNNLNLKSTLSLGSSTEINMIGTGATLTLRDGSYSGIAFTNVPASGKFSLPAGTNLSVLDPGGSASVSFGAASSPVQFNALYLGTDNNNNNSSTLNVTGAVVSFSGNADLGSHYGQATGVWNNATQAKLNLTGGTLNFASNVTVGGYGNIQQQPASMTLDSNSQINMTGYGTRLDFRAGTISLLFAATPTNGAFSVPAAAPGRAAPDLWLANSVEGTGFTPTLSMAANSNVQFNQLRVAVDNNSASSLATLNIGGTSSVTFNGDMALGRYDETFGQRGKATVNIANGAVVNVLGNTYVGGGSAVKLTGSNALTALNAGGNVQLGGLAVTGTISLASSSEFNMTASGKTLTLQDGDYSSVIFTNAPTLGKFSVPTSTNLSVLDLGASCTVSFGTASTSPVQFGRLYLGTDNSSNANTSTLKLTGAAATFSGNADLGSHYGQNNNTWANATQTNVKLSGGTLNFGSNVTIGGYGSGGQKSAVFTTDAASQINMTGVGTRLDLRAGTYNFLFATAPANGAFSVPVASLGRPAPDLWMANGVDNTTFTPTLNMAANSNVQFNQLRMGYDGNSSSSNTTLNLGGSATATFNGTSYVGGQGVATIGLASGAVLNFNQSAQFADGNRKLSLLQGVGQVNVAGTLINNGRFVATTGALQVNYGTLDHNANGTLSDNSWPGWYTTSGSGGQINLPALAISGTAGGNWGEKASYATFDVNSLVNSIRLTGLAGSNLGGTLGISLLDSANSAVQPGLTSPVGIWSVNPSFGLNISSGSLTIRYDGILAAAKPGGEAGLKLYENSGNGWQLVTGSLSTSSHLINGTGVTINSPVEFAVAENILAATGAVWNGGGGDNNWQTGGNWGGIAPTAGQLLHFAGSTQLTPSNNFTAGTSFGGIAFDANASGFTISGNSINLAGNIINSSSNNQTINLPIALAYSGALVNSGSNTLTLAGNLSNSGASTGGLNKQGSGTLVLSGSNSYSGVTTLTAGTLSVGTIGNGSVPSNLGAASAAASNLVFNGGSLLYTGATAGMDRNFTINSGQTATILVGNAGTNLTIYGGGAATSGALTKDGPGTLTLAGSNAYSGVTTVSNGTLAIGNGGSGESLGSSGVVLNNTSLVFNNIDTTTLNAAISGSGSVTKQGAGVAVLGGYCTYSGPTVINGGTLKILHYPSPLASGALPGTTTVSMSNNTTLDINGANQQIAELVDAVPGSTTGAQLLLGSGSLTVGDANSTTFSGAISGNGGGLTKVGIGALTLGGPSSYSGATVINGGALLARAAGALSPNSAAIVSGGTLDTQGFAQTVNSLTVGALGTLNLRIGGRLTSTNTGSLAAGSVLNVYGATSGTVALLSFLDTSGSVGYSGSFSTANIPAGYQLVYKPYEIDVIGVMISSVWASAKSGSWNLQSNWENNTVPSAAAAGAILNKPTNNNWTITLDGPRTVGTLEFGNSSSTTNGYTLSGASTDTLTLNNSGIPATIAVDNGKHAIAAPVNLASDLSISGSGTLTFSGSISETGSHSLAMSGTGGTLILSGTGLYTGGTIVSAGILAITTSTALPDNSALTVGAGGTLIFDPSYSASSIIATPVSAASSAVMGAVNPVPEPSTLVLLIAGLAVGLGVWRRGKIGVRS